MEDKSVYRKLDAEGTKTRVPYVKIFIFSIAFVLLVWGSNALLAYHWVSLEDWIGIKLFSLGDRGTFGDSFGSINALFAGLAFAGVAVGIFMQNEQLKTTREEMKATQEILGKQEENLDKQNDATSKQMFETTFFNLFSAFIELSRSIEVAIAQGFDTPDKISRGQDAIDIHLGNLNRYFREQAHEVSLRRRKEGTLRIEEAIDQPIKSLSAEDRLIALSAAYGRLYKDYGDDLGRYFRTLYTIMKFIKTSLPHERQRFYFKLIRAQLSSDESTILALNAMSPYSTKKFNSLIAEFGMLKNANLDHPILNAFVGRVEPKAFGRSNIEHIESYYLPKEFDEQFLVEHDPTIRFDD
ncbi:putative phage abortive infection protein [Paracoccus sp. SSK6]|uniref:putative phage abortive infection protein n=1 Tax=Paracoccus sp. SSK6 TaxID=3143131 RepID=UPI003219DCD0